MDEQQSTTAADVPADVSRNSALPSLNGAGPSSNGAGPIGEPIETVGAATQDSHEGVADSSGNGGLASAGVAGAVALLIGVGIYFRHDIKYLLDIFANDLEQLGPLGYVAYAVVYTLLELLAVPATPLTLTAGYIFGPAAATAVVSVSATAAAVGAFLIAKFAMRLSLIHI